MVTCPLAPDALRLISGFCSSSRDFALDFLRTPPRGDALALWLTFGSANTWCRDFHPTGFVPCTAHTSRLTGPRRRAKPAGAGPVEPLVRAQRYGAGFGVGELWNCTINQRSPRFCMTTVFRDGPAVTIFPSDVLSDCHLPDIATTLSDRTNAVCSKGVALTEPLFPVSASTKYWRMPSGVVTSSVERVP